VSRTAVSYVERLTVPWWGWPLAGAAGVLVAAEVLMTSPPLRHPLVFVAAGLLGLAAAAGLSRIRIEVDEAGGEVRVGAERLRLDAIAAVTPIPPVQRRDALGRDADPRAHVVQRPWAPGGVRIDLTDDATPYWYVSTRHPERLAAAIRAATAPR
jgi:hypothetical protein